MKNRVISFAAFAAVLAALTYGAYKLTERFLADRQQAIARVSRSERVERTATASPVRKPVNGTVPAPITAPAGSAATASGEAAIQRQLKTLQEINRLNEMNRQLMDQQQRQMKQR